MNKHKRNEPCHCGSDKKYKKCHLIPDWNMHKDEAQARHQEWLRNIKIKRAKQREQDSKMPAGTLGYKRSGVIPLIAATTLLYASAEQPWRDTRNKL